MNDIEESFHFCAAHTNVGVFLSVMNGKVDINVKNVDGRTALHMASSFGLIQNAQELIQSGADVNMRDTGGFTPLHMACLEGHEAVCLALINFGADINAVDFRGYTPMHLAAEEGHTKTMSALIIAGAEMEECTVDDLTPFSLTVKNGHLNSALLLISHGGPRTPGRERYSLTPFYDFTMRQAAVRGGFIDRLQVLLEKHPSQHLDDAPEALVKFAHHHKQMDAAAVLQAHMAAVAIEEALKPVLGARAKAH